MEKGDRMGLKRSSPWYALIPIVTAAMVVLIGIPSLATANRPTIEGAEDAVVVEVPIGSGFTEEDLAEKVAEAVAANPGMDVILEPIGDGVLSTEDRQAADEARAAAEDEAMQKWFDDQVRSGVFVETDPSPCMAEAKSRTVADDYMVAGCDGVLVGLASAPVEPDELEAGLAASVESLLAGIPEADQANGYYSAFSGRAGLAALSVDKSGAVKADFTAALLEELPLEPSADQLQLFNLQLYGALFQSESVNSVELTVEGKCVPELVWYGEDGCSMTRGFFDSLWDGLPVVGIEERTSS